MRKILFIVLPNMTFANFVSPGTNVRHVRRKDGKYYGSILTDMPLGVLSMSGYIKSHVDVEVRAIDFNLELNSDEGFPYDSFAPFFERLLRRGDYSPDIVGISALFTPSFASLLQVGAICRNLYPQAVILAGGSVPASMYREIFSHPDGDHFDAFCFGEGERPLLELVNAEDMHACLRQRPVWITRAKVEQQEEFMHDFIEDLDEIPFYDYELLPMARYGDNPAISAYAGVTDRRKPFHVMTSRGCPFKCSFCASHVLHGRAMRYYSVERVREDFKRLAEQYGATTLVFQDDHFMGDVKRAYQIIRMIKELGLTAVFQNGLALYALKRPMLEALHDAGVRQLLLSVETGSERVLREVMHKPLKLSIIRQVSDDCRELDIYTNTNILIGLPGETKQDIEDTRAFLKTVNSNWFLIFCANPLVGSEIHRIAVERGYLTDRFIGSDYKEAVLETEEFSAEYIQEMAYVMNLELNFVHNSDMRLGNYAAALDGFRNVMRVKHDHVFAYYHAALCCTQLGDEEQSMHYLTEARRYATNDFWKKYVAMFALPL
ncbi:MAG: radical SAM protein [Magnetococcales bacterium]|nr:radical SAM protein [Magnetococcales bacterium]